MKHMKGFVPSFQNFDNAAVVFFLSFDLVDYEMNDEEEEENDKDYFNNDDDDDNDYEDGADDDDDDFAAVFLILDLRSPQLTHQTELNFCNAP